MMTYRDAIKKALSDVLEENPYAVMLGIDIGAFGGRFGATRGLQEKFGRERVIDTPLSEDILLGLAAGAAHAGLIPIVEILYSDFLTICQDDIRRARFWRYLYDSQITVVIRTAFGGYSGRGPELSGADLQSLLVPDLTIFAPSTPQQVYSTLKAAVKSTGIYCILEHKALYGVSGSLEEIVPAGILEGDTFGEGEIALISYSYMSVQSRKAMEILEREYDRKVKVVDLNTVWPLRDIARKMEGVKKIVIAEECFPGTGIAEHIGSIFSDNGIAIRKINAKDMRVPFGSDERKILPSIDEIVREVLAFI